MQYTRFKMADIKHLEPKDDDVMLTQLGLMMIILIIKRYCQITRMVEESDEQQ
jgi:hypothetical protein